MSTSPFKSITEDLVVLAKIKEIWIAYSGGVDSHVLLHLLATAKNIDLQSVKAIHIDHRLHPDSIKWAQHCLSITADLGIDLEVVKVEVSEIDTLGLEAAARKARYAAFDKYVSSDAVLLTAQHQQDQAETLLLQLFRGAGPKGLASMAKQFKVGNIRIERPFLTIKQSDIVDYARQQNLQWIEDPSNIETRWNRNYIRHQVLPEIEKRWPSAAQTISRSAENCAEASELLTELAQQDLSIITSDSTVSYLSISKLLEFSPARRRNLLRYFIELKKLPLPSAKVLQKIVDEVCLAKPDSTPLVQYANVEIRRFLDNVYFMQALPYHDTTQILECHSINDLEINQYSALIWQKQMGLGLKKQLIQDGLILRFRQGGEVIQLPQHQHHTTLKHLFQQWQVPPWQRDRIPLLFSHDRLVAVAGYAVDAKSCVDKSESGYFPHTKLSGGINF